MGRPLSKRNFGDVAKPNSQIKVRAVLTGGTEADGFIVSQKGSKRYLVNVSGTTQILKLVTTAPVAGEMNIVATRASTNPYYSEGATFKVAKLTAHRAYDEHGHFSTWSFATAANGTVQLSNA